MVYKYDFLIIGAGVAGMRWCGISYQPGGG